MPSHLNGFWTVRICIFWVGLRFIKVQCDELSSSATSVCLLPGVEGKLYWKCCCWLLNVTCIQEQTVLQSPGQCKDSFGQGGSCWGGLQATKSMPQHRILIICQLCRQHGSSAEQGTWSGNAHQEKSNWQERCEHQGVWCVWVCRTWSLLHPWAGLKLSLCVMEETKAL